MNQILFLYMKMSKSKQGAIPSNQKMLEDKLNKYSYDDGLTVNHIFTLAPNYEKAAKSRRVCRSFQFEQCKI